MDLYFVECSSCGWSFHKLFPSQPKDDDVHICKSCDTDKDPEHVFRY